jgi:hypothetical protein
MIAQHEQHGQHEQYEQHDSRVSKRGTTLAIRIVRVWTRVYTWHLRPDLQARRRAEIDSDLWEFQQDTEWRRGDASPARQIVLRLLRGMPHDLCWCVEQADVMHRSRHARLAGTAAAMSATIAILFAALWLLPALRPVALPRPLPTAWPLARMQSPKLPCLPAEAAGLVSSHPLNP